MARNAFDLESDKPLRIGVVAQQLGISPSMLRAWERMGLRVSASSGAGSHRTYTPEDIKVLKRALYLRRVQGLNAPAILDQLRREGMIDVETGTVTARTRSVGNRLRMLRLKQKKSLSEVAQANDISVGFLSNLERSQTGASIGIMHRLVQYYGSTVVDFFSRTDSPGPLVRPSGRQVLHSWVGVRMDLLAWGDLAMEPHLFHIESGCGSKETYSHDGEEFLFIISGRLTLTLGETVYDLRKGDSFYFESKVIHHWINPGKTPTSVLWINTPPTF